MKINFILNGEDVSYVGDPNERALQVLQREFHLFSRKESCGKGDCGRCLVQLDGRLVPSCLLPAFRLKDKEVITPEGFTQDSNYDELREILHQEGYDPCTCTDMRLFILQSSQEQEGSLTRPRALELASQCFCRCGGTELLVESFFAHLEQRRSKDRGRL